jgi:hypothetical protein
MKKLMLIILCAFFALNAQSQDNNQLVGQWYFDLVATKSTAHYKSLGKELQHLNYFKGVSSEFTADGKLIQSKNGKVQMTLNYKIISQIDNQLSIEVSSPESKDHIERQVVEFSNQKMFLLHLANKDFKKIVNKHDAPIVMIKK